jgi:hypothetical protein
MEPLCSNWQCKYHLHIVDSRLRHVQVAPESTEEIYVVDDTPPTNETYTVLIVERVLLFNGNRKIGMYCVDCAKEMISKEIA